MMNSINPLVKRRRILCIAQSGIGNWLMQSPVFAALKKHDPTVHIAVLIAPRGTKALAEINPHIDEIIEGSLRGSIRMHWRQIQALRSHQFEVGIVLSPGQLWKSALLLQLAAIPMRIGHSYPWPFSRPSKLFLTHAIPERAGVHDIQQNLALLTPLQIVQPVAASPSYQLTLPASVSAAGSQYLQQHALHGKTLIGFHPGSHASMPWKRWPQDHFIALGKLMLDRNPNLRILLFGGPDEHVLARTIATAIGDRAAVIQTDLLTTAALIAYCQLFISNDSGLMHVAAAQQVPTLGLFGPTDEQLTGPRGQRSAVVRAPGTQPSYHTERRASIGGTESATMRALSPILVLEQSVQLLRKLGIPGVV